MAPNHLAERLKRVVDVVFDGSVHAAAIAASTQPSTLHRLVAGDVADPRTSTLRGLADAFGVPVDWLSGTITSDQAQRGAEQVLPEAFWLVRSFHHSRQKDARYAINHKATTAAWKVAERFRDFRFTSQDPAAATEPVGWLLNALSPESPERLEIERSFAELETKILNAAATLANSDTVQAEHQYATPRARTKTKRRASNDR